MRTWAKFDKFGEDERDYLTPGKWYPVVELREFGFDIVDDEGIAITCLKSGCMHIGNNWHIGISEEKPE